MDIVLILSLVVTLIGAVWGAISTFASSREKTDEGKMSKKDTTYDMMDDTDLDEGLLGAGSGGGGGAPSSIQTEAWKDVPPKTSPGGKKKFQMAPPISLKAKKSSPARTVLLVFSFLVLGLGVLTVWRYMDSILANTDALLFGLWLFLTMVAGMFVQVLASNYRQGKRLFHVQASQLVFPLLFSIVVFYPVWAIGASAQVNLFSFHAAFLNGYFWESVVSSARLPQVE